MVRVLRVLVLSALVGCGGYSAAPVCILGTQACRVSVDDVTPTPIDPVNDAEIVIRGGPFRPESTVEIDGEPAPVIGVSPTEIRANPPCGHHDSHRKHDLVIHDSLGTTVAPGAIRYGEPPPWDKPHCSERCPCEGSDAGSPGTDAGSEFDAGLPPDAGIEPDAGSAPDAGPISILDAPLPFGRADSTVVSDGHYLYALGGEHAPSVTNTTQILRIDPAASMVEVLPETLPGPREAAPGVWTGKYVYLFGGRSTQVDLLDTIVRYDPATGEVLTMNARLPTPRYNMGIVWTGTYVYLVGGFDYSYTHQILRYDPAADQLTVEPVSLPHGIEGAATFWYGGKMYLVGGRDEYGQCSEINVYDPAAQTVTRIGTMPLGVWAAASFFDGDAVYVLGGVDGSGTWRDTISYFRPATGESGLLPLHLASPRIGRNATWFNGAGYVVGGFNAPSNAYTYLDTVLRFAP